MIILRAVRQGKVTKIFAALLFSLLFVISCSRVIEGSPSSLEGGIAGQSQVLVGDGDTFPGLLKECERLSRTKIFDTVTGTKGSGKSAVSSFSGAICRWYVSADPGYHVTFNWFETNTLRREKSVVEELGYRTEIVQIAQQTAVVSTIAVRPGLCGVTANAPQGIFTWWVESSVARADVCAAPKKLMELILTGAL